jgi:hypothetical protein
MNKTSTLSAPHTSALATRTTEGHHPFPFPACGDCRTHIHFATSAHLLRANQWVRVFLLLKLPVSVGSRNI